MGKTGLHWTEEQYQDWLNGNPLTGGRRQGKSFVSKFNAAITEVHGIKFRSKKEARHYLELKVRIAAGEVRYFHRQVPFDFPGNVRYYVDFQEFWNDGSVHYVDVKGVKTPMFIMKRKQVEDLYPVKIELA